jgi:ParB family chromosome partitioning protein
MSAPKRRLGRGLDALLGSTPRDAARSAQGSAGAFATLELSVDALKPGRYQPRQTLSEENLAELADSIREQGVLQPLVVRPFESGGRDTGIVAYEIVAGERRWRAARIVGLATVPVIVRELDDQSALAVALIENLQREDLNPIEQARSLSRLAEEFELTHEQVAQAVGRSRSSVTNLLRLLDLHEEVKQLLVSGKIDMGHARALLPLAAEQQVAIARKACAGGWSVRKIEQAARAALTTLERSDTSVTAAVDLQTRWLQREIAKELGQSVTIRTRNDGTYKIDIAFGDLARLQQALRDIQDVIARIRAAAGPRARDAEE